MVDLEDLAEDPMSKLVLGLAQAFGRPPTETEVFDFIMGTEEERKAILKKGREG